MADLANATLTIPLGLCTFNGGQVQARLEVKTDGRAYLWMHAMDSDCKKSLLYNLDLDGLAELQALVKSATDAVAELQAAGRIQKLELRREGW